MLKTKPFQDQRNKEGEDWHSFNEELEAGEAVAVKEEEVQAKARRAEPTQATQEPEARAQEQQVEEVRRE